MSPARTQIAASFDWQGIIIEVVYEPNWLGMADRTGNLPSAHLDIRSIKPERAPLPITETGYRSHFLHPDEIDELGGPVAYVEAWLNEMARSSEWQESLEASKQLSLF
tara:strand:+ start:17037 stop:17360 length:324 start_codon:yes stop_codon:yes gene_type:complete